jgi:protein-disulfide isomerase
VRFPFQAVCALLLAAAIPSLGCRAQVPAAGTLSPEVARRVELLLRSKTKIPPDYTMAIGPREPSDIAGFDKIQVIVTSDGTPSHPIPFLISKDGKTLAQFNQFDISKDPKTIVSGAGRPGRGGDADAPVEIVVFDDLECPYCARMHTQLFPALLDRYGKNVRIVYRDYPLSQHPWAMHAAVDVDCVGTQSAPAYWNIVDYIHAHAADFGGADKSLQKATDALDKLALDEATRDNLNAAAIDACIRKQDTADIKASMKMGDDLGVEATPVLFINGEKLEGAYPLKDVFRMVDEALTAEGKTPPAPYKEPAPPSPMLPKPGN